MSQKGLLIIISGPAGSGKGTIVSHMREKAPFEFSVSATTRAPRPGEIDGVHYHFIDKAAFEEKIRNGDMLEHAEYVGNYYGTPKAPVEKTLSEGKDIILDIEVQGALQVKEKMPDAVMVFVLPPDAETLEGRLRGRGTETDQVIEKRMNKARTELSLLSRYDYVVINQNGGAEQAAEQVLSILLAERSRTSRNLEIPQTFFKS